MAGAPHVRIRVSALDAVMVSITLRLGFA